MNDDLVNSALPARAEHNRPTNSIAPLRVGQAVVVQHGALAGMRGILVRGESNHRWVVRLDEAPPGVFLEIHASHLLPCEVHYRESNFQSDPSRGVNGLHSLGEVVVGLRRAFLLRSAPYMS